MKSPTKLIVLSLSVFFLYSCNKKHDESKKEDYPKIPAYVNFSLGKNTLTSQKTTSLTLFGCNTSLTSSNKHWNGPKEFQWEKSNQVLSGIPYGDRIDSITKKPYYISKYYIASPPILKFDQTDTVNSNTVYDIGIVTPDEFSFDGESPTQMAYLDYSILKPMHIDYIDINFDKSLDSLGVGYVPFRVECNDLPWIDTDRIKGGKGGSGIGSLEKGNIHAEQLFLPYYFLDKAENDRKYLNTKVTILNDILLNYKIKFIVGNDSLETINLKDFYFNPKKPDSLRIVAFPRTDTPSGCVRPKAGGGPFEGVN
jgi:hypothetical protein